MTASTYSTQRRWALKWSRRSPPPLHRTSTPTPLQSGQPNTRPLPSLSLPDEPRHHRLTSNSTLFTFLVFHSCIYFGVMSLKKLPWWVLLLRLVLPCVLLHVLRDAGWEKVLTLQLCLNPVCSVWSNSSPELSTISFQHLTLGGSRSAVRPVHSCVHVCQNYRKVSSFQSRAAS